MSHEDDVERLAEAERAAELVPHDERAHLMLGRCAWQLGRLTQAQLALESAVRLSDRDPAVLAEYAAFMAQERGPRPAAIAARKAVDADTESPLAWAALALAQYRLHQRTDAETSVRTALRHGPTNGLAQALMVTLLRERGEDAQAAALVDVMQDDPEAGPFVAAVRKDLSRRRAIRAAFDRPGLAALLVGQHREPKAARWLWRFLVLNALLTSFGLLLYFAKLAGFDPLH